MMAFHCIAFNVQKYVALCSNDPQRQQDEMEDYIKETLPTYINNNSIDNNEFVIIIKF